MRKWNNLSRAVDDILIKICNSSCRHPFVWLFITLALSVPAIFGVTKIGLDTNLARLLPEHSPAARWTKKLQSITSEGSYFTIIFESQNQEKLRETIERTAKEVARLEGVGSVDYKYPYDFIQHYRYLLIPDYYLERIYDYVLSLEAEYSPFATDIISSKEKADPRKEAEQQEMRKLLDYYSNLSEYHQSIDGRVMGMFIRPQEGFTDLDATQSLYLRLSGIAEEASRQEGVWAAVGGSQINNLREYNIIKSDLSRTGIISVAAIIIVLLISFKSLLALPILFFPLSVGLLWSFGCVPFVVGNLNMITSFLLVILFGVGDDYSIHLLKRFQLELLTKPPAEALVDTYLSTGRSVIISALTTALPLLLLTVADFRGFSEFGLVGGGAVIMILLAMFIVMPSTLILAERIGMIKAKAPRRTRHRFPYASASILAGLLVIAGLVAALAWLRFDYDFRNMRARIADRDNFNEKHGQVYTISMSPAAVYVVPNLHTLDKTLKIFKNQMNRSDSKVERVSSIRDFSPDDRETRDRLDLIDLIKEELEGSWTKRVEDRQILNWIEDLKTWKAVQIQPGINELPPALKNGLMANDNSGRFLLGIYPNVSRRHGKQAMVFTDELYRLEIPENVSGPIGEMPIFAEILWLVTSQGPWLLLLSFLSVVLLVFLGCRSIKDTLWTMLPLVSGIVLTLGLLGMIGLKLNFFNVVTIPTLLGIGIDHGVHYYRRWKELGKNTIAVQEQLFSPLTACTATTLMGYSGLIFANQAGLQSIGKIACLGLACIWFTSLILFPGILIWLNRKREKRGDT